MYDGVEKLPNFNKYSMGNDTEVKQSEQMMNKKWNFVFTSEMSKYLFSNSSAS